MSNDAALVKMRKAGSANVRMSPANATGDATLYQVEVLTEGKWEPVTSSIPIESATQLMQQANNRVILG